MAIDRNLSRLLLSAALALPIAFGLFLVMHLLIDRDWNPEEKKTRKIADIHMPEREMELIQEEMLQYMWKEHHCSYLCILIQHRRWI